MSVRVRAAVDLRLLRAGVFSVVCVALAAIGHVSASGAGIAWWALGAAWAVVMLVVVPLAGCERGLPGITAVLLGAQLVLHALFCLGQSVAPVRAADSGAGVLAAARSLLCGDAASGHLTAAMAEQIVRAAGLNPAAFGAAPSGMTAMAGMGGTSVHGVTAMSMGLMLTPSMVAAHVLAGLVMGWLLRTGERAVWRAAGLVVRAGDRLAAAVPLAVFTGLLEGLAVPAAPLAGSPRRRRPVWDDTWTRLSGRWVVGGLGLRGPPGTLAV
ncbi:hypothetical protein [Streptacidiphilus anmyonensis]|uniref:hypothetical protein n=1 Tax=Streptacidiphilus anmyonensis TaxID=405782 RepID=UPI00069464A1|nr:hypothetical protein [Streptacidiphilus anmyonensis]